MKKEFDVILLGYYGFGNLGDELLCEASLRLLESCGVPRQRVAVLSASPSECKKKYGVRAFDRWSLRDIWRACATAKSLLLGGGGLFQDSTSARSCFYYYAAVRIARTAGLAIWAEGQSVGPLGGRAASRLAKRAFSACRHVSVRDESSRAQLAGMGIDSAIIPDLVMSLQVPRAGGGESLLFNARPGYRELAVNAASECAALAEESGRPVTGVALSRGDMDEMRCLESAGFIKFSEKVQVSSAEDFSRLASWAFGALGMRLHFLILSALSGLPLRGCAYDPKVRGLCMRYNISLTGAGAPALSPPVGAELAADEAAAVSKVFAEGLRAALGEKNG